ncbi:NAD(P)/FAD-dependent oxidoreductase [Pseudoalteromonas fenneropenaei]|uniref:NAD(P)/FAD-dependent oxidoreductase n=1 Tax=Pseudoalteromonas fenneropenaei TaxID=1737459 RepID=A0ABV7CP37_9GAMM
MNQAVNSATNTVVILGGGLAGSTLARQVKLMYPSLEIKIIESNSFPVPLAKFKVGESTVDIAGHYLRNVLGLEAHLEQEQLPKYGLRFFLPAGDNKDITQRVEVGNCKRPASKSYQLDRGKFENFMHALLLEQGVDFIDSARVTDIQIGNASHIVTYSKPDGSQHDINAHWVLDASGGARLLQKALKLPARHTKSHYSAWFRVVGKVEVNALSSDSQWLNQVPEVARQLCTNHLVGKGYWVWIIPLSGNNTSIGVVVDPELHDVAQLNTLESTQQWLQAHEPQLAHYLQKQSYEVMDYKTMGNFTYRCDTVFSPQRWALTGISGSFTDPFYSPGTDFIAIANTLICKLIGEDLAGNDLTEPCKASEQMYFAGYDSLISTVENQYGIFAHNLAMSCKLLWDGTLAWSGAGVMFCNDRFTNSKVAMQVSDELMLMGKLHTTMQQVFRRWSKELPDRELRKDIIVDRRDNFGQRAQRALVTPHSDEELVAQVKQNFNTLCSLAAALFRLIENKSIIDSEVALLVSGYQHESEVDTELNELLFG